MPNNITITTRMPKALNDKAKRKAKREHVPLSQVIRVLIREWLKEG